MEDVDKGYYAKVPDLRIPLTAKGRQQSATLGDEIVQLLGDSTWLDIFTSPGTRNIETVDCVVKRFPDTLSYEVHVDPLLVKQNWGTITLENRPAIDADRYKTGVLRYTFPTGESAAAMISRFTEFGKKLLVFQQKTGNNAVVLSNGFEFRVLLMLLFGWSEDEFESYTNLENGEYRILTLQDNGKYTLDRPLKKHGLPITRLLFQSLS
jgi:broad specificity phosphatase PhoE